MSITLGIARGLRRGGYLHRANLEGKHILSFSRIHVKPEQQVNQATRNHRLYNLDSEVTTVPDLLSLSLSLSLFIHM